jgi:hypothetical protein
VVRYGTLIAVVEYAMTCDLPMPGYARRRR